MPISRASRVLPAHFVLKRLHSLTGMVPLGIFLVGSGFMNVVALVGTAGYDRRVAQTQGRLPLALEFLFILLPLAFHAAYGLVTVFEGRVNVHQYPHAANVRYTVQRLTGVIAAVFVGWHVYAAHWIPLTTHVPLSYAGMNTMFSDSFFAVAYGVGMTAAMFHFFNSVWSALVTWGVTVSSVSQRFVLRAASLAFVAIMLVHAVAAFQFAFPKGLLQ
jgi:succinate dehydrogenase / fumarate reductase cytochrome b subunit